MTSCESDAYDAIVVGARCGGAATAMILARLGHRVALVEKTAGMGDTLSTHGLARGAVVQLDRWDLLDAVRDSGAPPVTRVSFATREDQVVRALRPSAGVNALYAPRRPVLDQILLQAAVAAGAVLMMGTEVKRLVRQGGSTSGRVVGVAGRDHDGHPVELRARLVVGADGLRGKMASLVRAPIRGEWKSPSATFYSYAQGLSSDTYQFHVGDGCLAGVFPTNDGDGCVWLCLPSERAQPILGAGSARGDALRNELRRRTPLLAEQLAMGLNSAVKGAVGLPMIVRDVAGPGWALVGDAAYHRDPVTGHGITDALRDAELLATAAHEWLSLAPLDERVERRAMGSYQRARDASIADVFAITDALTKFPHPDRFVALQRDLGAAIDREAEWLAARPAPWARKAVTATDVHLPRFPRTSNLVSA
jgi:2-polyprenyl-6-methoxyphenol hydroxylase-like FAD-dependent oxidoreductase